MDARSNVSRTSLHSFIGVLSESTVAEDNFLTMLVRPSLCARKFAARCMNQTRNASKTSKKRASPDDVNQMTISQAIPYLRASEAGYTTKALHLAIRLKSDKQAVPIRGTIALPRQLPSKTKVAVFARGQDAVDAKNAGAYIVGAEDLVKRVADGIIDFDKCLATPECVPLIAKLARTLGPKGLMPNPKRGTVVKNVAAAIQAADRNLDFRQRSGSVVRLPVAHTNFSDDEIRKNIEAVIKLVAETGSRTDGGGRGVSTIDQIVFSSTHGPGIPLSIEAAV